MYDGDHPAFVKPADFDATLWRYIDFTKFVSLLDRQALYFCRADRLDDRFEGSFSNANLVLRPQVYKDAGPELIDKMRGAQEPFRRYTYLNCWSMAGVESPALWRVYVPTDEGVAVRSTFRRLTESLTDDPPPIYAGVVQYLDYDRDWVPEGNTMGPFMCKRHFFDYEREVRALTVEWPNPGEPEMDLSLPSPPGIYVPMNLDRLVETICVSPSAPDHFFELVESVVARYGLDRPVTRSALAGDPVF